MLIYIQIVLLGYQLVFVASQYGGYSQQYIVIVPSIVRTVTFPLKTLLKRQKKNKSLNSVGLGAPIFINWWSIGMTLCQVRKQGKWGPLPSTEVSIPQTHGLKPVLTEKTKSHDQMKAGCLDKNSWLALLYFNICS